MSTVLAALDDTAAARPVLDAAIGVAELMAATVEAVHVGDGTVDTPRSLATISGIPFHRLDGPVEDSLLGATTRPEVIAVVLGARSTAGGRRPAGRTALRVLERSAKPVVVVPPAAWSPSPRPLRRLLVPLEGTDASSRSATDDLAALVERDVEIVVLHVFTAATLPRFLDRPARDLDLLGHEFLVRHCPLAATIELRTGPPAGRVAELCEERSADMIVLSWSQDSSPGHAAVVRAVLARSAVPVLLLPVSDRSCVGSARSPVDGTE